MSGIFARAADWLEFGRSADDGPMCVHHGPACAMGAEPLDEIYVMVIRAKQRAGQDVPPLDEHRPMTLAERTQYWREFEEALAEAKAKNAQAEAEIWAGGL